MRIVIAGGSGFLGRALSARLLAGGHDVAVLTRSGGRDAPGARAVIWDPDGTVDVWAGALDGADAVVNLAGAGIGDRRWTPARKRELRDSRLRPTESLVRAVALCARRPGMFLQGSAVGYYGASLDATPIDETHPAGTDFLARLCVDWDGAAMMVEPLGCRLVTMRTGLVLARQGGALPRMALPFRLFAGGRMGTGRQYLAWIHVDDWVALAAWAIGNPDARGVFNATAPAPVTNAEFASALGAALERPSWLPAPAFALRLAVGTEMADLLLLNGQRVVPGRAPAAGFRFSYPDVHEALVQLYRP
jgi:uncharacterized protein